MASVNKVILIGNLGRDPEMRYMPSGEAIANLAIATSRKYKNKAGEMVEETEWHRVTFFGKLAEIAGQYLKKGRSVYVEGRIKTDKYTDKEGVEKYATEIRGDRMQMLGSKGGGGGMADMDDGSFNQSAPPPRQPAPARSNAPAAAQRPASSGFDDMDDDIPF
ncbi:MAG: single-stranded DNA-binding protein [Thiobacillus sp.]|nr:single-stranded DNA-binding protein [Thiobacillus sp.]